jgi:hypothetical protein
MLALPLAGCIRVPDYYVRGSNEKAPKDATTHCREVAAGHAAPDINATSRPTPSAEQAGNLVGNSVGDAILFRRTYSACMESSGYARGN